MSGTRAISTTSSRELSSFFFSFLQDKAPKEIHAILAETLACFLPSRAKDLPASLYYLGLFHAWKVSASVALNEISVVKLHPANRHDESLGVAV